MKFSIVLALVLGVLTSNVLGNDWYKYRMLSMQKPNEAQNSFVPLFTNNNSPRATFDQQPQRPIEVPRATFDQQQRTFEAPRAAFDQQQQRPLEVPRATFDQQQQRPVEVPRNVFPQQPQQPVEVPRSVFPQQPQQQVEVPRSVFPQQPQQPVEVPRSVFPQQPQRPVEVPRSVFPQQPQRPVEVPRNVFPQQPRNSPNQHSRRLAKDACLNRRPEEMIPNPEDLNSYIVCHASGEVDIMRCPNGLVFNPNTKVCDRSTRAPLGCASSPCKNGGICTDLPNFRFTCGCPAGFIGELCEREDVCSSSSCGPNGVCIPLGVGHPIRHYCVCNNKKSFGMRCDQNTEPNPCTDNSDSRQFPFRLNPSIFVQCDGVVPIVKFCPFPLHFSEGNQRCDWAIKN